ncbi:MAG: CoA transferase [Nitrospinae bacterium]|nr:CoA transferase [Nitrospinota bacterium]
MEGALSGIRVLDCTRVLAGPYATMVLADLGADVVKVEEPTRGDEAREVGPFIGRPSAYFISLNRGKKSLTLNLKEPDGRQLFIELAAKADVVVENFRPGTMEQLGLGYETLRERNPRLIYAACSGFGQTGPLAGRAAYDIVIQGMGGVMSITGTPGGEPVRVGVSIGDITAAFFTVIGILAALQARERTGEGQLVDVGMLDSQVAILENAIIRFTTTGEVPKPLGTRHPSIAPFEAFPAKDGHVIFAVGTAHWGAFCRALGRAELVNEERFATNALRAENVEELRALIAEVSPEKTVAEWIAVMEDSGVPCGPINTIEEVASHIQVAAREMLVEVEHEGIGTVRMAGCPVKLSATPGGIQGPAPALGEHSETVLAEWLGMSSEEVSALRKSGVVSPAHTWGEG